MRDPRPYQAGDWVVAWYGGRRINPTRRMVTSLLGQRWMGGPWCIDRPWSFPGANRGAHVPESWIERLATPEEVAAAQMAGDL
jgi:hypothetical protein